MMEFTPFCTIEVNILKGYTNVHVETLSMYSHIVLSFLATKKS